MLCYCRSPTVVLAYLMHLRRWRLSECYKWLSNIHPAMQISPGAAAGNFTTSSICNSCNAGSCILHSA